MKLTVTDILPLIRKPSSYLGGEINSIQKKEGTELFFALCFPDSYEIGMSHFGIQILYHILNKNNKIAAERVFSPAADMEDRLRTAALPVVSLESQKPLNEFDIIGFSLLYELNYTNILTLLDLSGIPFYSKDRGAKHPIIVGGGPCTVNPEPVADFFDAFVVGDGEEVVVTMTDAWLDFKEKGRLDDRNALLAQWSKIPGVYIPAFFSADYDSHGFQRLTPEKEDYLSVSKAIVSELKKENFPDKPVLPFGRPVHDRLRLEIARGCSRGCRFCQAGMIYRPVRERGVDDILDLAEAALDSTGYEDISFLSLSTGDFGDLNNLLSLFLCRYQDKQIAVSIPSFRAGSLTSREMALIKKIRKTGFTIAPEAGSQRLRDVINKNISEEDIINTVNAAFDMGWNLIKLYFMVGLPTETDDDLEQIVSLARAMKKLGRAGAKKGGVKKINVSVATFVPKPHTPFQWESQIDIETARGKLFFLKDKLSSKKIGFKWQNPEMSLLEGVFARGDRRLSRLIEAAYKKGCRFDGWTDSFNFKAWQAAAESCSIDLDFYTTRQRKTSEPLPWDLVGVGIEKDFFIKERQKAYDRELTADCRDNACSQCGVCDFKAVAPRLVKPAAEDTTTINGTSPFSTVTKKETNQPLKYEFSYTKKGPARFFGHLEFINIILRAINRARVPVFFSQGFHPKPKISFEDSLPVGMESEQEFFSLAVTTTLRIDVVVKALNQQLPEGIDITGCRISPTKKKKNKPDEIKTIDYRIAFAPDPSGRTTWDMKKIEAFLAAENPELTVKDKNGRDKTIPLKPAVSKIDIVVGNQLVLQIKQQQQKRIRPLDVVEYIFDIKKERLHQARVIKVGQT